MGFLTSEQPPESLPEDAREYMARINQQIDRALNNSDQRDRLTALPIRPIVGKDYYFSNAVASEPVIDGEGYYGYKTTGWVKLG